MTNTSGIGVSAVRSPEINAKTFSTEVITDTESYEFIPTEFKIEPVEANGVVVPAIVSIGTNSPDYNNIVPATVITSGLQVQELVVNVMKIPENTEIKVKATLNSTAIGNHKFRVIATGSIIL